MALRVVGAGVGRTGTNSLKVALEMLLGGSCYHMVELFERPRDTAVWLAAVRGEPVDWSGFLSGYSASVDWPACAFWRELHAANPDSLVLLSSRRSAEEWRDSMERTVLSMLSQAPPVGDAEWVKRRSMTEGMMELFDPRWREREPAVAAYERHNEEVRREVPAGRLIDWQPGDGWEPICAALDLPAPDRPFPHVNTTADFQAERDLDRH